MFMKSWNSVQNDLIVMGVLPSEKDKDDLIVIVNMFIICPLIINTYNNTYNGNIDFSSSYYFYFLVIAIFSPPDRKFHFLNLTTQNI